MGPTPLGHNELVFADPDSEPGFVHVPDILGRYTIRLDDLSEALEVVVDSLKVFRSLTVCMELLLQPFVVAISLYEPSSPLLAYNRRIRLFVSAAPLTQDVVRRIGNKLWTHRKIDAVKAVDIATHSLLFWHRKLCIRCWLACFWGTALEAVSESTTWHAEISRHCSDFCVRKIVNITKSVLDA